MLTPGHHPHGGRAPDEEEAAGDEGELSSERPAEEKEKSKRKTERRPEKKSRPGERLKDLQPWWGGPRVDLVQRICFGRAWVLPG